MAWEVDGDGMVSIPLMCSRFALGLAWDNAPGQVDLDVQAVAFDPNGKLLDAVYYNNLKALGKGLTHSGDETTGEKSGQDEVVWVNLDKISGQVGLVVFVVAAHSGGHLRDARNGVFSIFQDSLGNKSGSFPLENSIEEVDLVGALLQVGNGWSFKTIEVPARDGKHFIDILEPVIGDFVRSVIPRAPRRIKAAFAMEKGSVVDLPQSKDLRTVKVGLGWDTGGSGVDVDVSAVLLDSRGASIDAVFFGNLSAHGVTHSGDNLTGAGSGDDEVITVNLQALTPAVQQIAFVINVYTQTKTFAQVANPFCRVMQENNSEELCRYMLSEAGTTEALVIARLFKDASGVRWGFQALGQPATGRTWKASIPTITRLCAQSARAMQAQPEFGGAQFGGARPMAQTTERQGGECCVTQ